MWIKYFFADKPFVHLWKVKELGILLHHDWYKAAGSVYNQPEMSNIGCRRKLTFKIYFIHYVWCLTLFHLCHGGQLRVYDQWMQETRVSEENPVASHWKTLSPNNVVCLTMNMNQTHNFSGERCKYKKTTVLKVETDIIRSIASSPIGWSLILVIMYVETFKTDIIVFIRNFSIFDVTPTDNFQYQSVCWYWQYHSVRSKVKCPYYQ